MQCEPKSARTPRSIVISVTEDEASTCNDDPRAKDVDYSELLSHPVLPPNPHFFWFYQKFHITKVAKCLSVLYVLIYLVGCVLIYQAGVSITVMFSSLIAASVALTTLYAVFRWKKLCLIPFFCLQVIIIINVAIFSFFIFYAMFVMDENTSLGRVHKKFTHIEPFSSVTWMCILLYGLFLLEMFLGYSIKLMLHEYEFIAAVDTFLKAVKKSSGNPSKDGLLENGQARMQLL